MNKLVIAVTKGRIEKKIVELLRDVGIDTSPLENKGRKLIFKLDGGAYEIVLAKANDVLVYVEHGVCDIGFVGKDTICEQEGHFYEVLDLQFGKCKFCIATNDENKFYGGYAKKKVATKYPNITRKYFYDKGIDVDIIKIEGSVELAPLLGLSDAIADIVETGATLKENGLKVIEEIFDISARMVVNIASMKMKEKEIEELTKKIGARVQQDA